jgi:predicted ATPase/DNA-binding XRE family transcriptional regulator
MAEEIVVQQGRDVSFGDLLREGRLQAGLSQEQLAEMAGISVAAISALERGSRRAPYSHTVALLVKALRLNPEERLAFEAVAQAARVRRRVHEPEAAKRLQKNIPLSSTSLLGREDDITKTIAALAEFRVVTVTGSGGIGKTRLALEIARGEPNGQWDDVCFADLTSLSDGAFIAGQIASTIQPPLGGPVESVSSLVAKLAERRLLLILDNCEHLTADVAAAAHAIVTSCRHVTILATSRERLQIEGESIYRLPPLALPDEAPSTLKEAARYSALDLFLQRSRQRDPSIVFTNDSVSFVYNICRRLEGIPLAIELAVARLPFLGLKLLDAKLDEHFSLPGAPRNLPLRQQSMQATIAWSFDLLGDLERDLFSRIAIFSGGFTFDAARSVCAFDTIDQASVLQLLASLVDKSLIQVIQTENSARYVLLESVRSFALEQLDRSQLYTTTARRHAQWLAAIADDLPRTMSLEVFTELRPELENARAALAWSLNSSSEDDHAVGARIVAGLRDLWFISGHPAELGALCVASLALIDEEKHPKLAAKLLHRIIVETFNEPGVLAAIERAIPLFDRIGDAREIIALHSSLTYVFATRGLIADARRSAQRVEELSAIEKMQTSLPYARFLYSRAMLHESEELFDEARADLATAESIATLHGEEAYNSRWFKIRGIFVEAAAGDLRRAIDIANEVLASEHGLTPAVVHQANECLACLHLLLGEADAAEAAARAVFNGAGRDEALVVQYVAGVAILRGHPHAAARLMGFIEASLERAPLRRDTLQQRAWDLLCASVAKALHPDVLALLRAEGARLSAPAGIAEAAAALALRSGP